MSNILTLIHTANLAAFGQFASTFFNNSKISAMVPIMCKKDAQYCF